MKKTLVLLIALFFFTPMSHAAFLSHVSSSTGIDSSTCGAVYFPCKTIAQGVTNAGSKKYVIKIAVGNYSEYISINDSNAGLRLLGGWSTDFSVQTCNPNLTVLRPLYSQPVMELNVGTWGSISVDVSCMTFKGADNAHRTGIDLVASNGEIKFDMSQSIVDGFAGNGMVLYSNLAATIDVVIRKSIFKNAYQPAAVSHWSGGGISAVANTGSRQTIALENCLLYNNEARKGAAIYLTATTSGSTTNLSLTNVTLSGNVASNDGGGLYVLSSDSGQSIVDITNSIVWGNSAGFGSDIWIHQDSGTSTVNARYSIIDQVDNFGGIYNDNGHNLNRNPRLDTRSHLTADSPAIDAALCGYKYISYYRVAPYDDIDGDSRPGFGKLTGCDIGADEYIDDSLCFPVKSNNGKITIICM